MGLDQYLTAKKNLFGEIKECSEIINLSGLNDVADNSFPSVDVSVVVIYWRKSNQIHKWFVQNVQNGVDNCEEYYVTISDLKKLLKCCEDVLAAKETPKSFEVAKKILPPTNGFFFGNADIGERYYEDLEHTVERIKKIINYPEIYFYYSSSW